MFYEYKWTENSPFLSVRTSTVSLSLPVFHACDPSVGIDRKPKLPKMAATLSLTAFAMYDKNSQPFLLFSWPRYKFEKY